MVLFHQLLISYIFQMKSATARHGAMVPGPKRIELPSHPAVQRRSAAPHRVLGAVAADASAAQGEGTENWAHGEQPTILMMVDY